MWSKGPFQECCQCALTRLLRGYITWPHYVAPVNQHRYSPACPLLLLFHCSQPRLCFLSFDLFTAETTFQCSFNPLSVNPLILLLPTPTTSSLIWGLTKQYPRPSSWVVSYPCKLPGGKKKQSGPECTAVLGVTLFATSQPLIWCIFKTKTTNGSV